MAEVLKRMSEWWGYLVAGAGPAGDGTEVPRPARLVRPTAAGRPPATAGAAALPGDLRPRRFPRRQLTLVQVEKTPFRMWPSWPKKLVVGDGLDLKLNPEPLVADHLIVTGLWNT